MDPMILSVMYVWCQLNQDVIVSFWFGTQFKVLRFFPIYIKVLRTFTQDPFKSVLEASNKSKSSTS